MCVYNQCVLVFVKYWAPMLVPLAKWGHLCDMRTFWLCPHNFKRPFDGLINGSNGEPRIGLVLGGWFRFAGPLQMNENLHARWVMYNIYVSAPTRKKIQMCLYWQISLWEKNMASLKWTLFLLYVKGRTHSPCHVSVFIQVPFLITLFSISYYSYSHWNQTLVY